MLDESVGGSGNLSSSGLQKGSSEEFACQGCKLGDHACEACRGAGPGDSKEEYYTLHYRLTLSRLVLKFWRAANPLRDYLLRRWVALVGRFDQGMK